MSEEPTRTLTVEQEVEASAAQVWDALTTGEGLRRWFPLDAKVVPGREGSVWLSWGPGCEGQAPIHAWDPPSHFGWTESHGTDEDGRPIEVATDFHVEGRGGSTVVRLVQSGLPASAEWDEMVDALEDGWTYFLFNLAFHFRVHDGGDRTLVWRRHPTELTREDAWTRLEEAGLMDARSLLDREPASRTVSVRKRHHVAAELPDLNDSLWFVELEGRHVGFWLSVYDADGIDVEALQSRLDVRVGEALGRST